MTLNMVRDQSTVRLSRRLGDYDDVRRNYLTRNAAQRMKTGV